MLLALMDAKIQICGMRGGINLCRCVAGEKVLAEMAQTTPKLDFVQPRHRRDSILAAPACAHACVRWRCPPPNHP